MNDLKEVIRSAIQIKKLNNLSFVTIWKTGELFGFNFEKQPIGYEICKFKVKRTVVGVY